MKLRLALLFAGLAAPLLAQKYVSPTALPSYAVGLATGPGNQYSAVNGALIVQEVDAVIASGSVSSAATLFTQELASQRSVAVQITNAGTTCTVTYELSNDNVNWVAAVGYNSASSSVASISTSTAAGIYLFHTPSRYFRARVSTYTSGTVVATALFRSEPLPPRASYVSAAQNGTWTVMPGNTANTTPWLATPIGSAAQGASTTYHLISAATTNATSVKATAGTLNSIVISNAAASARYFKLYNLATAPTVGTSTPIHTVLVPAASSVVVDCGPFGLRCSTGIAIALTTGIAVADTGAIGASEVAVNLSYF